MKTTLKDFMAEYPGVHFIGKYVTNGHWLLIMKHFNKTFRERANRLKWPSIPPNIDFLLNEMENNKYFPCVLKERTEVKNHVFDLYVFDKDRKIALEPIYTDYLTKHIKNCRFEAWGPENFVKIFKGDEFVGLLMPCRI